MLATVDAEVYACRIIDIWCNLPEPKLLVKVWLPESKVPQGVNLQPLNPTASKKNEIPAVIHTNWLRWIVPDLVLNYAYIIHRDGMNSGMYANVYGMNNSFFVRYGMFSHKIEFHVLSIYESRFHTPFSHLAST